MAELKKWRVTTTTSKTCATIIEAETAEDAKKKCEGWGWMDFTWHEIQGAAIKGRGMVRCQN